jgi:hypothetical protein
MKILLSLLVVASIAAAVYYSFIQPQILQTQVTSPVDPVNPIVMLRSAADVAIEEAFSPLSIKQDKTALSHLKIQVQGIDPKLFARKREAAIKLSVLLQQVADVKSEFSKRLQDNEVYTKNNPFHSGSSVDDREMRLKHFDSAIRKQWEARALQLRMAVEKSRFLLNDSEQK